MTAVPALPEDAPALQDESGGWTGWVRRRALRSFPPDQLLPDKQPIYVASWIYVFGVATIAAFIVTLAMGSDEERAVEPDPAARGARSRVAAAYVEEALRWLPAEPAPARGAHAAAKVRLASGVPVRERSRWALVRETSFRRMR